MRDGVRDQRSPRWEQRRGCLRFQTATRLALTTTKTSCAVCRSDRIIFARPFPSAWSHGRCIPSRAKEKKRGPCFPQRCDDEQAGGNRGGRGLRVHRPLKNVRDFLSKKLFKPPTRRISPRPIGCRHFFMTSLRPFFVPEIPS